MMIVPSEDCNTVNLEKKRNKKIKILKIDQSFFYGYKYRMKP